MSPPDPYTFNFHTSIIRHQTPSLPFTDAPDFAAKYRAQAEYLGVAEIPSFLTRFRLALLRVYADGQANNSWFGWAHDGSQDANLSAVRPS